MLSGFGLQFRVQGLHALGSRAPGLGSFPKGSL